MSAKHERTLAQHRAARAKLGAAEAAWRDEIFGMMRADGINPEDRDAMKEWLRTNVDRWLPTVP